MQLQGESATWTWADLLAQAGPGLDRFAAEFAASGALRDGVLAATFDEWAALGVPPETGEDEHLETWALLQEAMLFATVGGTQSVAVRSIGFVGATGASLQVVVDGVDATGWAGFPSLPPNIVPAPPVAHALLLARSTAESRPAQLARWSRLSTHLALLQRWLPGRFAVDIDPHLAGLRVRSPDHFALAWVPGNNARIASLQLSEVQSDGQRQPLDLGSLDAASGVVSASANEPILLPPNIAAVAARARVRQRRLVSTVSDELADPARVIPEGVDVDGLLDLSDYAERVIGFERYKRADKPLIHDPSGIDWSAPPDESAFLHLPFRREGEPPTLVPVSTEADAREMLSTVEAALAGSSASPAITFAGHQIVPTAQLRETLGRAIRLSEERRSHEERGAPLPRAGPLAAVLAELDPSQTFDEDGPTVDEASVPFARLAQLLLPGVTLKPHQRRGVAWLWHHASHGEPGVLLADDMGLGKTLQVAALLALRDSRPETGPHLVVAPTILLHTWQGEFARFFRPEVFEPLCVLHGDSLRRLRRGDGLDTDSIGRARLVLTNYETLGAHQKSLLKVPFSVVVFDEAQALKNESTLRSRGAQGLKRELAIGMTGTPVENKLSDLWALFEALQQRPERRAFGRRAHFETAYESQGAAGVASVRARLRFPSAHSVVLRREKAQALRDLPPKVFHEVPVEMTGHQFELERVIAREMREKGAFGVLDKLRKLYQHPALVTAHDRLALDPVAALSESPKTARTLSLLREIQTRGEKALVFTQWASMQELLRLVFLRELGLRRVNIINGDPRRRAIAQQVIDDFTASPGFDVLILSPLAAGVGLTITAANHVIHYGRWWNPAKEDQATDRAHRIGQTREVHVYYPLLHHPGRPDGGFDVKLHRLVEAKRAVARDFLAPSTDESLEKDLETSLRGAESE